MVKVIMHGCFGHMGRAITNIIKNMEDIEIVAGIDKMPSQSEEFKVFPDIADCNIIADVIIDFSTATAVPELLGYSVKNNIPIVLCTTGLSAEIEKLISETSKKVALFRSANMSLGINLLESLLKKISPLLYNTGFDIEIIEKHHNLKIDAPSGTALQIADTIKNSLDGTISYVYDRSKTREKRTKEEIGIHALRGGTIVGEHSVIFAGNNEVLEFKHTANSKEVFAVGAVNAAKYLKGKAPALYSMKDLLKDTL